MKSVQVIRCSSAALFLFSVEQGGKRKEKRHSFAQLLPSPQTLTHLFVKVSLAAPPLFDLPRSYRLL